MLTDCSTFLSLHQCQCVTMELCVAKRTLYHESLLIFLCWLPKPLNNPKLLWNKFNFLQTINLLFKSQHPPPGYLIFNTFCFHWNISYILHFKWKKTKCDQMMKTVNLYKNIALYDKADKIVLVRQNIFCIIWLLLRLMWQVRGIFICIISTLSTMHTAESQYEKPHADLQLQAEYSKLIKY